MKKKPAPIDEEKTIYDGAYKPFSIVKITPKHLVGKGLAKLWPGQFHGKILLSNILRVEKKYLGLSKSSVKLFVTYRTENGTEVREGILFYESYIRYSDFDPEKFYKTLLKAIQND